MADRIHVRPDGPASCGMPACEAAVYRLLLAARHTWGGKPGYIELVLALQELGERLDAREREELRVARKSLRKVRKADDTARADEQGWRSAVGEAA